MERNSADFRTDLRFVIAIILEAVVLMSCLVSGISVIGYILPVIVACVCTTLTALGIRDFFRQHR